MEKFKKLYVWTLNAKLYMGIYFVAIVFLTGIVKVIFGGDSIQFLVLLEMLILSMVIALLQVVILDERADYSGGIFFGRSVLWLSISVALTVICALMFEWFAGLAAWCPFVLGAFMVFGFSAMLAGLKLEQDAETVRLNAALNNFKKKSEK
ncbi:MAG: hypothetical protein AB7C97_01875 [Oscillospiraceae bacterium]